MNRRNQTTWIRSAAGHARRSNVEGTIYTGGQCPPLNDVTNRLSRQPVVKSSTVAVMTILRIAAGIRNFQPKSIN